MLGRIIALFQKESLAVWRDKKSRIVLIMPPLIQLLVFAFAATLDVTNVTIGIVNRDNGAQGFELAQRFHGAPTFKHIVYLPSVHEIGPFIDNQRGMMVVSIDEEFSRKLDASQSANVQLILDGRKSNSAQIIAGYAQQIVSQFNEDFTVHAGIEQQNTQLVPRNWFNPNLIYLWFNVPSLCGIITMLVALILTALSIAREREMGTFDQLLVSPMQPLEILIGKALPAIVIAMAEGSIIVIAAIFIFQIPLTGSLLLLYGSMFFYVCAIVGVGLFISALCSTQQQAILVSYIFLTPAILLSGFATPIENMPTWLQYVTYANPPRYFLVVARGVFLKAMPADVVFHNTWPMAIIALCTLTIATRFFRRKLL